MSKKPAAEAQTKEAKQEVVNAVQSKVLTRLQQELSFVSAYKNMDSQVGNVEKEIEQWWR
jgi:hypothetical protein